jgi:alpha-tubulin suppressor-like RCC1 family protein
MNLRTSWSSLAEHSIFVTQEGEVLIWGHYESVGQIDGKHSYTPIPLSFPERDRGQRAEMEALACGQRHSLALMRDGRVFGWGCGTSGELGELDSDQDIVEVVLLSFPERPVFLAAGSAFPAVITEGGGVYLGEDNHFSKLGTKPENTTILPTRVPGIPPMVEMSGGWYHMVARTEEGQVWSWGKSTNGEAGHNRNFNGQPTPLPPFPEKIVKVACGGYHSLFLGEKGTLWSCGWKHYGTTGHGAEENCWAPRVLFSGEGGGEGRDKGG